MQLHPLQKAFLDEGAVQCGYLHARNDSYGQGAPGCKPEPHGGRNPAGHFRQPVPLHGLYENRRRGAQGGRGGPGRWAGRRMMSKEFKWIGKPMVRYDGVAKVTGAGTCTPTICAFPGCWSARSCALPTPMPAYGSIDTSKAEALPGVKAVATGQDTPVPMEFFRSPKMNIALAVDKVRLLVTRWRRWRRRREHRGARPFPHRSGLRGPARHFRPYEAMVREDVKIHEHTKIANIERQAIFLLAMSRPVLPQADYIREDSFFKGAATHAPIEPHSALAHFRDGKLTVWTPLRCPITA